MTNAPSNPLYCKCGERKVIRACTCCGASLLDCPSCPYVEVRAGVRLVAPLRCFTCATRGCRGTKAAGLRPKCGHLRGGTCPPPKGRVG